MKIINDQVQWLWDTNPNKYYRESKTVKSLINAVNNSPLQRARICLHEDPLRDSQCMLIALSNKSYIPIHKHQNGNESYFLTSGKVKLILFNDFLEVVGIKSISADDKNERMNTPVVGVEKGVLHTLISESSISTFVEFRNSPQDLKDRYIDLRVNVTEIVALKDLLSLQIGSYPNKIYFSY